MQPFIIYLKNRENAISFLLNKPKYAYSPSTFHKLRVEIKKLNAFFELIKFCSKNFKRKEIFKPFKLIFRHAGKIRELQIEEMMLKKYFLNNLLIEYRTILKKLRLREQESYFSIVNKKFVARLKKKYREIVPFLEQMDKKKVNRYIDKKRKKLEKLLSQTTLPTPQVHELRKRLKKFNYNLKSLNFVKQNKSLPKKDVLPELLGKWHDCLVTIKDLQKAMETVGANTKEVSQLKKIKEKISVESEILFNKINVAKSASEFLKVRNKVNHATKQNNTNAHQKA